MPKHPGAGEPKLKRADGLKGPHMVQQLAIRARGLLPAVWLGVLLCVALIATPAGFALLPRGQAGALAGRILGQEAYLSLFLGLVVLVLERLSARRMAQAGQGSQFTTGVMLALGAIFCTVLGYFALQGPMAAARAGQGTFSFGQLHGFSLLAYGVKVVLVAALAWRGTAGRASAQASATTTSS
jgi:Domain of unknown function (DUF4149)